MLPELSKENKCPIGRFLTTVGLVMAFEASSGYIASEEPEFRHITCNVETVLGSDTGHFAPAWCCHQSPFATYRAWLIDALIGNCYRIFRPGQIERFLPFFRLCSDTGIATLIALCQTIQSDYIPSALQVFLEYYRDHGYIHPSICSMFKMYIVLPTAGILHVLPGILTHAGMMVPCLFLTGQPGQNKVVLWRNYQDALKYLEE